MEKLSGFFIGLWIGNSTLFDDDKLSRHIPADVEKSKWYHPVNGKVVNSGKVVKELKFQSIEDIKINLASSTSVVVGCGWDLEKNEVYFTCDGSKLNSNLNTMDKDLVKSTFFLSQEMASPLLVYPAIRFPGNSGLKATISFGNNTLRFAYKCPPMGLKLADNTGIMKSLNEWINAQTHASKNVPIGINGAGNEIEKILIKKKEVVVKRDIDSSVAVLILRIKELREVLSHSIKS